MKSLHQSLNDMLHEKHSPENDNFGGSKLAKGVSMQAMINRKRLNVLEEKDENDSDGKEK